MPRTLLSLEITALEINLLTASDIQSGIEEEISFSYGFF